jgi:hypothetical protein
MRQVSDLCVSQALAYPAPLSNFRLNQYLPFQLSIWTRQRTKAFYEILTSF